MRVNPFHEVPVTIEILQGDNAQVLPTLAAASFDLIYADPPSTPAGRMAASGRPRCGTGATSC